jgi:MFS family permease
VSQPPERGPSAGRIAVLLGTLVALTVIGSSAVAVALPSVAADLELDTSGTAWILACFSLAFSITTAVFGRLADIHGLRRPLRIGAVLFAAGSLLAAFAWSFPAIIAGRLLQGAGAGAVPVLVLGIIAARFEGPARAKAIGAVTAVVSIVSGSGPLIGGAITELAGWRAVLAIPAIAVVLAEPVARLAPADVHGEGELDVRGAALVAMLVAAVTLLLQSPATGLGPLFAALFAGGAALAGGLLWLHTRRRPRGFLPEAVVGNRMAMLNALAGLTLLAAYLGMLLGLPLLLADGQGWSPLHIGLAMWPAAIVGAVVSLNAGALVIRFDHRRVAAGLAVGSVLGLLLAGAAPGVPVLLVVGMALVASGFAGGQAVLVDAVSGAVAPQVRGVALGVFNLLFFTGGAVGAATVGGLSGLVTLPGALACLAVLPALGAVLAARAGRRQTVGSGL